MESNKKLNLRKELSKDVFISLISLILSIY